MAIATNAAGSRVLVNDPDAEWAVLSGRDKFYAIAFPAQETRWLSFSIGVDPRELDCLVVSREKCHCSIRVED